MVALWTQDSESVRLEMLGSATRGPTISFSAVSLGETLDVVSTNAVGSKSSCTYLLGLGVLRMCRAGKFCHAIRVLFAGQDEI